VLPCNLRDIISALAKLQLRNTKMDHNMIYVSYIMSSGDYIPILVTLLSQHQIGSANPIAYLCNFTRKSFFLVYPVKAS
jgi:hypothetical protein